MRALYVRQGCLTLQYRRHDRSGQRPAPRFIHARDEREYARPEVALEFEAV